MIIPKEKPAPTEYRVLPPCVKRSKLSRKFIRFQNEISPSPELDYNERIASGGYLSTVMGVHTAYCSDGRKIRTIRYDVEGAGHPRFRMNRVIRFNPDGTTDRTSSDFIAYLKASGIKNPYWLDYIGCRELVVFNYSSLVKYRRCDIYEGTPPGLIEIFRMFYPEAQER